MQRGFIHAYDGDAGHGSLPARNACLLAPKQMPGLQSPPFLLPPLHPFYAFQTNPPMSLPALNAHPNASYSRAQFALSFNSNSNWRPNQTNKLIGNGGGGGGYNHAHQHARSFKSNYNHNSLPFTKWAYKNNNNNNFASNKNTQGDANDVFCVHKKPLDKHEVVEPLPGGTGGSDHAQLGLSPQAQYKDGGDHLKLEGADKNMQMHFMDTDQVDKIQQEEENVFPVTLIEDVRLMELQNGKQDPKDKTICT